MKKLVLILCLLIPLLGNAQEIMPYNWREYIELWAEEGDDDAVDELLELYENYHDTPANINDTSQLLQDFPFITTLQREALRAYIALYGPLLSLEELYSINGFDSITVELLRPLVTASAIETHHKPTFTELLTHGRHNLVTGSSGTIEQARGYRDSIYEGDNLRLMWRYSYNYKDRIKLQLSGDKDPGEAFFAGSQKQGFDFYGYSLLINDLGKKVRRLVVGQFHAQFGQGLTLWSGFGSRNAFGTGICRHAPGLRPSGAFTEYGYLRGLGTTLALSPKWDLTLLYSYVSRDATLPRNAARDSSINWVQSIYNSGYHRTQTEIAKENQLDEHLLGGHLEYHNTHLRIGLSASAMLLNKEIIPATYVYNDNYFHGDRNFNSGIDATYRLRRLLLFGEAAICYNDCSDSGNISPAMILGAEFTINSNHRASAQLRHYSPTYHNLHASALGKNSTPQNETGFGLNYQGHLPWGLTATMQADWFRFPHIKYLVYAPSNGQEYRVTLSYPLSRIKGLSINLRYRYKDCDRNVTPTTQINGAYLLEKTYRHQLQGDIEYTFGAWKTVTRIAYAHYRGDVTQPDFGLLFYQDLQYRPQRLPLTIAARIALFNVKDYEARLYTVESDFIYQYNSTSYLDEGYRFYLLAKYDINQHWNIGIKYAITQYSNRDDFGSSYDLINAPHRQQWRIQMRLKF